MQRITLEVILRLVFGFSSGAQIDRLRHPSAGSSRPASSPFILLVPPTLFAFARKRPRRGVDPRPLGSFLRHQRAADAILAEEIRRRRTEPGAAAGPTRCR